MTHLSKSQVLKISRAEVLGRGAAALAGCRLEARYGFPVHSAVPSRSEWALLGAVVGVGLLASAVPDLREYRYLLADGMTVRV